MTTDSPPHPAIVAALQKRRDEMLTAARETIRRLTGAAIILSAAERAFTVATRSDAASIEDYKAALTDYAAIVGPFITLAGMLPPEPIPQNLGSLH